MRLPHSSTDRDLLAAPLPHVAIDDDCIQGWPQAVAALRFRVSQPKQRFIIWPVRNSVAAERNKNKVRIVVEIRDWPTMPITHVECRRVLPRVGMNSLQLTRVKVENYPLIHLHREGVE